MKGGGGGFGVKAVDLRELGGLGINVDPEGSSRRFFQGFSKVLQEDPPRCPQGLPRRPQGLPRRPPKACPNLPRHLQGLPKRVHGETYNFVKIVFPSRRNINFSGLPRYMLTPSWPRATMLAHVGPKLTPSCCMLAPVGLKLAQVDPKLTPSWPQVGPCWLMLAPSRTQVGPCWPMLAPSGLQVGP